MVACSDELTAEVDARLRLAAVLGTPEERRALRRRLGLTISDVSSLTGLSPAAVRRRESEAWQFKRGSLVSESGWLYVQLLARARRIDL
jgi:hypothetical protein